MGKRLPLACLCAVCCLALLALATGPAAASDKTPAEASQADQAAIDAPETFDVQLSKAQAGDARAQCEIGVAYVNGSSVPQDFGQGLDWLTRSSDAGFGYARFVLADLYNRGYGVPVDDAKAYYFASLAAASSSLADKYRERAVKLRNASAKRLTTAQLTSLQAKAALAPLDAVAGQ